MVEIQVLIPVFNDAAFLPQALRSATSQTDVNLEILVFDNASTDGSWEIATNAARRDPRIRVIRHEENIGMLANFNAGLAVLEAPFFMMLCSDDVLLEPGALRKALDVVNANNHIASVYCDLQYIDGRGRKLRNRTFNRQGHFDPKLTLRDSVRFQRNLFGIPLLHRTSCAKQFTYPADMPYVGDVYLSYRISEHGDLFHLSELLIGNRFTSTNATATLFQNANHEFGRLGEAVGVQLSAIDKIVAGMTRIPVRVAKLLFLRYAKLKNR